MSAAENVERLPKWAQRRIQVLEMRLAEAHATLSVGTENSDTFADPYQSQTIRPLGRGTMVRFAFDGNADSRAYVDVRLANGLLQVRGSESFRLYPQVSNTVLIELGWAEYR